MSANLSTADSEPNPTELKCVDKGTGTSNSEISQKDYLFLLEVCVDIILNIETR